MRYEFKTFHAANLVRIAIDAGCFVASVILRAEQIYHVYSIKYIDAPNNFHPIPYCKNNCLLILLLQAESE
jgi:hypothetical protein